MPGVAGINQNGGGNSLVGDFRCVGGWEPSRTLYNMSNNFSCCVVSLYSLTEATADTSLNHSSPRSFLGRALAHMFWNYFRVKPALT